MKIRLVKFISLKNFYTVLIIHLIYFYCTVAPNITVSATPAMIVGNERQVPIRLTCTASVVENITSLSYQLTWMRNGMPVDHQLDNRIMVQQHYSYCIFYQLEAVALIVATLV